MIKTNLKNKGFMLNGQIAVNLILFNIWYAFIKRCWNLLPLKMLLFLVLKSKNKIFTTRKF